MYLIFPESMIIPEVADRREDDDFEAWLTAAVIENANQQRPGNNELSLGVTDLWMSETAERNGKIWTGKFHVAFNQEKEELPEDASMAEQETGVLSFALNIATGEMVK